MSQPETSKPQEGPPETSKPQEGPPPADAPCEEAPRQKAARPAISKASIRRLAHDVGARVGREALEGATEDLKGYVATMLRHASLAMSFSRKKSISLNHMSFASDVCGQAPSSLRALTAEHLKHLAKSNPKAPSALRKDVLWRAEISEASFGKVMKGILKESSGAQVRVTSQARRLLQLLAEYHVMKAFDRKGLLLAKEQEEPPLRKSFARVFACSEEAADLLVETMKDLERHIPALLGIGATKTVDERLLRTALGTAHPWARAWVPPPDFVSPSTRRALDRFLRASVVDKRVTASSGEFLAACLTRIALEKQGLPVPEGGQLEAQEAPPPPRPAASLRVRKAAVKAPAAAKAKGSPRKKPPAVAAAQPAAEEGAAASDSRWQESRKHRTEAPSCA
jgi:histone H3/H4